MPQAPMNDRQREHFNRRRAEVKALSKQRRAAGQPNITLQGYSPDTCGCYIIEVVDKMFPPEQQKMLDHMAYKCPAHDMLSDDDCYDCIVGPHTGDPDTIDSEQRRKNSLQARCCEADDQIGHDHSTPTDEISPQTQKRVLKTSRVPNDDVEYCVHFSGVGKHRKMEVCFIGGDWTPERKAALQQIADALPGENEIVDPFEFHSRRRQGL